MRERLRGQLIVALYRSGRQADALEAYRDAKRTLDEELGLEPSPALRELERAILTHDESLAATAVVDDRASSAPPSPDPPSSSRRTWGLIAGTCASLGLAGASVALALSREHPSAHEPPAAVASPPAHHVVCVGPEGAFCDGAAPGGGPPWSAPVTLNALLTATCSSPWEGSSAMK